MCDLQCLVIAGLADYARPADKLSVRQSSALAATGLSATLCVTVSVNLILLFHFIIFGSWYI